MTSRREDRRSPLLPGRGPLASVPPIAVFVLVAAAFGVGVWLRGPIGAALLGLLFAAVVVLLAATWSRLTPPARALRLVVLAVLALVIWSVLR